jgi:hypothetical protein
MSLAALLLGLAIFVPAAAASPPAQAGKAAPAAAAAASSAPAALCILSDTALGEPFRFAKDLRWASDHSVVRTARRGLFTLTSIWLPVSPLRT